jgi:hypothetical protein
VAGNAICRDIFPKGATRFLNITQGQKMQKQACRINSKTIKNKNEDQKYIKA